MELALREEAWSWLSGRREGRRKKKEKKRQKNPRQGEYQVSLSVWEG